MIKKLRCVFFALLLLPLLCGSAQAEEPEARLISYESRMTWNGDPLPLELTDCSGYARLRLQPGELHIQADEEIGAVYLEFAEPPESWTLLVNGEERTCGEHGYLHEYVGEIGAAEATLRFDTPIHLCDIFVFSAGEKQDWVQDWAEPWDRADVLFLPTHSDDDQLFFAGLIPWCISEGARIQVAYFVKHYDHADRMNELLDGLWTCGLRNYPILGPFRDMGNIDYNDTLYAYNGNGVYWNDFEGWQVELYRRFQPQVVVTHARNGEYGHGAHILNCLTALAGWQLSGDETAYPETAERYGVWTPQKLYVHNHPEKAVRLDFDSPLDMFGGSTAFQLSQEAFRCHPSQVPFYGPWLYGSTTAAGLAGYPSCDYGLYYSTVGDDVHTDTLFDNIELYDEARRAAEEEAARIAAEQEAARIAEEQRLAAEEAARIAAEEEAARLAEEERLRQEIEEEKRQLGLAIAAVSLIACAALAAAIALRRKKQEGDKSI